MTSAITFSHSGSFDKTERFLRTLSSMNFQSLLASCAQEGISALASATPTDSGLASNSWGAEISVSKGGIAIYWTNSDIEDGFAVAVMIQYGYGTGTGGYVQGRDYINPAMRPVFDNIANKVWKAVTSA